MVCTWGGVGRAEGAPPGEEGFPAPSAATRARRRRCRRCHLDVKKQWFAGRALAGRLGMPCSGRLGQGRGARAFATFNMPAEGQALLLGTPQSPHWGRSSLLGPTLAGWRHQLGVSGGQVQAFTTASIAPEPRAHARSPLRTEAAVGPSLSVAAVRSRRSRARGKS